MKKFGVPGDLFHKNKIVSNAKIEMVNINTV